jgi:membrane protease YdiL (CAAX protease family)
MIRKHPLVSFTVIAYAFSWIFSIPFILSEWGYLPSAQYFNLFFIVKSFGPALSAFILTRTLEGDAGWQNLKDRVRLWRVGWKWYAFILLGIPVVMVLGILALPGALASFQGLSPTFWVGYPITFILIFFGGGPLGEEPGWRGFVLPRLQSRFGALRATLILGVIWTFWHLPDFLTSAQRGGPGAGLSIWTINLPIFFLMVTSMAFVFTWVANHTQGSLLTALLLHASINTFGSIQTTFSAPIVTHTDLPFLIGFGVLALLILVLTRGRLGYQTERKSTP